MRLSACEQHILTLNEAVTRWSFPADSWRAEARSRLNRQFQRVELSLEPLQGIREDRGRALAIAASVFVIVLAPLLLHRSNRLPAPGTNPSPGEVLTRASSAEAELFRPAVHEVVTVEIEEIAPMRTVRRDRLEAVSDPETGRFTAAFRDENGRLKQALWKPNERNEFIYRPTRSRTLGRRPAYRHGDQLLTGIAEGGLESWRIEEALMEWLENRPWRPISFSADLAIWARQDGTMLRVERLHSPSGSALIRLTARRADSRGVIAIWSLELDAASYRPSLQVLRFEAHNQSVEIRFASTSVSEISRTALMDAAFRPDSSLLGYVPSASSTSGKLLGSLPLPPPASQSGPDEMEGIARAFYALHQTGACTGSAVEISESPKGIIIRNRESDKNKAKQSVAVGASASEALAALADLRNSAGTASAKTADPVQRQITALRLHISVASKLARLPSRPDRPRSDIASNIFQTMVREHASELSQMFSAPPFSSSTTDVKTALFPEGLDRTSALLRRVDALRDGLNALELSHDPATLQPELDVLEKEYTRITMHLAADPY